MISVQSSIGHGESVALQRITCPFHGNNNAFYAHALEHSVRGHELGQLFRLLEKLAFIIVFLRYKTRKIIMEILFHPDCENDLGGIDEQFQEGLLERLAEMEACLIHDTIADKINKVGIISNTCIFIEDPFDYSLYKQTCFNQRIEQGIPIYNTYRCRYVDIDENGRRVFINTPHDKGLSQHNKLGIQYHYNSETETALILSIVDLYDPKYKKRALPAR